jgi:hypothetical protein
MNAEAFTFCQFSAHFLLHLTQETYLYAYAQFVVQYSFLVKKSPLSLLPLRGGIGGTSNPGRRHRLSKAMEVYASATTGWRGGVVLAALGRGLRGSGRHAGVSR